MVRIVKGPKNVLITFDKRKTKGIVITKKQFKEGKKGFEAGLKLVREIRKKDPAFFEEKKKKRKRRLKRIGI